MGEIRGQKLHFIYPKQYANKKNMLTKKIASAFGAKIGTKCGPELLNILAKICGGLVSGCSWAPPVILYSGAIEGYRIAVSQDFQTFLLMLPSLAAARWNLPDNMSYRIT